MKIFLQGSIALMVLLTLNSVFAITTTEYESYEPRCPAFRPNKVVVNMSDSVDFCVKKLKDPNNEDQPEDKHWDQKGSDRKKVTFVKCTGASSHRLRQDSDSVVDCRTSGNVSLLDCCVFRPDIAKP